MSAAVPKDITIKYFNMPGRAEPDRLALKLAGIPFTDDRLTGVSWGELKPTVKPWGQLPMLVVDGVEVFQSMNIHLYIASITGFVPEKLHDELKMRELMCALEDISAVLVPTFAITDPSQQLEARAALCRPGGKLIEVLQKFEAFLGDRPYVAGDKLSMGDICLFTFLGTLTAGLFQGIPVTLLESVPVLEKFFKSVASRPDVRAIYEAEAAPWGKAFLA